MATSLLDELWAKAKCYIFDVFKLYYGLKFVSLGRIRLGVTGKGQLRQLAVC